jgi:hypothetical protein
LPKLPSAAIRHFEAGLRESKNGNFDLAIEDFTIAIEISSHSGHRVEGKRVLSSPAQLRPTDEPETVTFLDPFTAVAYANRGFARHRQGHFAQAIAELRSSKSTSIRGWQLPT